LLDEIRASTSDEEAKAKYEELQLEVWNYLPVLKFGDKNFFFAVADHVQGFQDVIGLMLWNVEKTD